MMVGFAEREKRQFAFILTAERYGDKVRSALGLITESVGEDYYRLLVSEEAEAGWMKAKEDTPGLYVPMADMVSFFYNGRLFTARLTKNRPSPNNVFGDGVSTPFNSIVTENGLTSFRLADGNIGSDAAPESITDFLERHIEKLDAYLQTLREQQAFEDQLFLYLKDIGSAKALRAMDKELGEHWTRIMAPSEPVQTQKPVESFLSQFKNQN